MKKYKTILADNNREYLRLITEFLNETGVFDIQDYAFDGQQAYELVMKHRPDLLIFDLIMPAYDGFAVLEELDRNGYDANTKFVMTSAISLDFILKKAENFNIDYLFLKPFKREIFNKRVLEIMKHKSSVVTVFDSNVRKDPKEIVTKHIKTVGITANVKGYYYLRDAILSVHENFELLSRLTTGVYVSVAKKYNSTPQRVERAMRHAIESAWNRGDIKILQEFFGYTILDSKGKPTNGEFIAMLADKLNTELKHID